MIKILSLPVGMDACSYYRIKKVFQGIEKIEPGTTHVIDSLRDNMEALPYIFASADVIYVRPGAESGMFKIKQMTEVPTHAKWVLDIDDNMEEIDPLSSFYQGYGQHEVAYDDQNGKRRVLWKDGKDDFSLVKNKEKIASLIKAMKEVDLITTTTPILADYANQYNTNVSVNRNTIDLDVWWKINGKINKPLRILWHGSPSHFDDWAEIQEPMAKLFDEYEFDLYMLGSNYKSLFPKKYHNRLKTYPWVAFDAHSFRCMSLQPDMAIIPLKDSVFNRHKSAIKWLEMSAMSVPSIIANNTPYKEVINDGKTALAYNNKDEFYQKFKQLIENKGMRSNIGNAANQEVRKNHGLLNESTILLNKLKELCQIS